jgi:hypothetical protein
LSALDANKIELASGFTVGNYKTAVAAQEKKAIADALRRRFNERYIEPVTGKNKHGFAMMAISCLMIESLESFHHGWENSNGRSEAAFCRFFDNHSQFNSFRGHFAQFYKNVRCGIVHQAETTGGWRVIRKGALFDAGSLTINATSFLKLLREVLDAFCDGLTTADWNSVRKKMKALCDNCKP